MSGACRAGRKNIFRSNETVIAFLIMDGKAWRGGKATLGCSSVLYQGTGEGNHPLLTELAG